MDDCQVGRERIIAAAYVLEFLLKPWRDAPQDKQTLTAMAIALEELAAELRQEASDASTGDQVSRG